jgi:hypothetical protein
MLLMIDNYDSFTYNVVQYLGELQADVKVVRNDEIDVAGVRKLNPEKIVISPDYSVVRRSIADIGHLSWPPKHWPGIWRKNRTCAQRHAWQDITDIS